MEKRPEMLEVVVFEGVQNLPIFAAQERGLFERHRVEFRLHFTPNSWTLRDGLAAGRFQIAHTAVDNAIAMVEMANADLAVVMGGDSGFNCLVAQPEVQAIQELSGKKLLVDAPDTAFALVLYKILALHGIVRADFQAESVGATPLRLKRMLEDPAAAASIMNLPFRVQAEEQGLRVLGEATDHIGPYLSTTGFVMRQWAEENGSLLKGYIKAYVQGLRWALDPLNTDAAIDMLARRLQLSRRVAERSYRIAAAAQGGLAVDAALDLDGLENVLRLRSEIEQPRSEKAPPIDRYIDLSWYAQAMKELDADRA
jgi:ABC-type nitrate/sulfonate/bicarbonate transport system substrate-binding protein